MGTTRQISIATSDYDHFRDVRSGVVPVAGAEPVWHLMGHHEIFEEFRHRRWDVTEVQMGDFVSQISRPDCDIIGLPIISSRLFRLGVFHVNRKSGIRDPADLRGKRVGLTEWTHTAAIYNKGWLHNEIGLNLADIEWVLADTNAPGSSKEPAYDLPPGVRIRTVTDRSLDDMIVSGEIDATMVAKPLKASLVGNPDIVRLIPEDIPEEKAYYAKSGIWPIMHILAIKKELLAEVPELARALFEAFELSKRRSLDRLSDMSVSRYPFAWPQNYVRGLKETFGADLFPFGERANRKTLEAFLTFALQQGIAARALTPGDLFATELGPT